MSNPGTQRLIFAYVSAVIIIALLLTDSQLIIQATLFAEVSSRDQATTLNQQELRTQRLLRNSLLLLTKDDHTVPLSELNQDIPAWQQTESSLEQTLSSDNAERLAGAKDDYNKMRDALLSLVAEEKKSSPDQSKVVQGVATIFYAQRNYLSSLTTIYVLLSRAADDDVVRVRIIELIIYTASLIVLCIEALVVIRPALKDYKRTLALLEKMNQSATI